MYKRNSFNFKFFIVALFFSIVSLTGLEANEKCLDLEFSSNSNNQTPELSTEQSTLTSGKQGVRNTPEKMAPVPMAVRGLNGTKRKISRGVTRVLTGVEIAKVMEPCIHVQRSRSLERK